jgi:hypothetical protein
MATTPLKCRELFVDGEDLQFKIDAHGAGFPDASIAKFSFCTAGKPYGCPAHVVSL